ncbi:hypothetical protein ACSQ67_024787 [Phaseolus vulgaris]
MGLSSTNEVLNYSFTPAALSEAEAEPLQSLLKDRNEEEEEKLPFVGVNIGMDVSNLPPASDLVAFLQLQKITHVRIYDANPDILKALSGTKIRVIISVPNNQLLAIGSSNATAASWIDRNVVAYYPQTLIAGISVGDEVLTTVPSSAPSFSPPLSPSTTPSSLPTSTNRSRSQPLMPPPLFSSLSLPLRLTSTRPSSPSFSLSFSSSPAPVPLS